VVTRERIFSKVELIRAFPRRLIRRLPNLLLLRSCLTAVFLDLPKISIHPSGCLRQSTERLPRRLVHRRHSSSPSSRRPVVLWSARLARRAIPPDDAEDLAALHLKRNILQRVDPVRRRLRLRRRVEGRGSRVESRESRVEGLGRTGRGVESRATRVEGRRRFFTTDITN
jgi:hypothetical protein